MKNLLMKGNQDGPLRSDESSKILCALCTHSLFIKIAPIFVGVLLWLMGIFADLFSVVVIAF